MGMASPLVGGIATWTGHLVITFVVAIDEE
jgi:hypothetical protein